MGMPMDAASSSVNGDLQPILVTGLDKAHTTRGLITQKPEGKGTKSKGQVRAARGLASPPFAPPTLLQLVIVPISVFRGWRLAVAAYP